MAHAQHDDVLLTYQGASQILSIKLGTLYQLVHEHRIPHVRLGGRLVRFRRAELLKWLEAKSVPARDADRSQEVR